MDEFRGGRLARSRTNSTGNLPAVSFSDVRFGGDGLGLLRWSIRMSAEEIASHLLQ
jgi:hypothetical protein